jgi:hypothetical protein
MNIRTFLDYKNGYYLINREERNLAAIFYNLLLQGNNLNRFLATINCSFPVIDEEMAIYFEYAYLRDLWNNIDKKELDIEKRNCIKKSTILEFLKPINSEELSKMSIFDFNKFFGSVPRPSSTDIQSPGNWSIRYYEDRIKNDDEFLKVSKFKWCFNAKPDIVIHTTHDSAICIEAKFESIEGKYPSNDREKEIFNRRGIPYVGQLHIQKKIMNDLLGIETKYIFLVQKKSLSDTHETFSWKEVFSKLDIADSPHFVQEWLKRPDINRD